jgi:hypothetical protein
MSGCCGTLRSCYTASFTCMPGKQSSVFSRCFPIYYVGTTNLRFVWSLLLKKAWWSTFQIGRAHYEIFLRLASSHMIETWRIYLSVYIIVFFFASKVQTLHPHNLLFEEQGETRCFWENRIRSNWSQVVELCRIVDFVSDVVQVKILFCFPLNLFAFFVI